MPSVRRLLLLSACLAITPGCAKSQPSFVGQLQGDEGRAWNGQAAFCRLGAETMIVLADTAAKDVLQFVAARAELQPGAYRIQGIDQFHPDSGAANLVTGVARLSGPPGRTYTVQGGELELTATAADRIRGRFTLSLRSSSDEVTFVEPGEPDGAAGRPAAARGEFTAVREECPAGEESAP
ncbi:MAG: hypothetical protein KY467_10535 [Gemmatimonadetes bacterium]|nr:hypothetical protein [Gemmatimonadota bacterium]